MNIFVLDRDIRRCARFHCDQHVIKMILESVQILCTSLNKRGFVTPYRSTHVKHPCVLWVDRSYDNFLWLSMLAEELNREYRYRWQKHTDHASMKVLRQIRQLEYERAGLTEFAQAMPDEHKHGNVVRAYRDFYWHEKMQFARWTRRPVPAWIRQRQVAAGRGENAL